MDLKGLRPKENKWTTWGKCIYPEAQPLLISNLVRQFQCSWMYASVRLSSPLVFKLSLIKIEHIFSINCQLQVCSEFDCQLKQLRWNTDEILLISFFYFFPSNFYFDLIWMRKYTTTQERYVLFILIFAAFCFRDLRKGKNVYFWLFMIMIFFFFFIFETLTLKLFFRKNRF